MLNKKLIVGVVIFSLVGCTSNVNKSNDLLTPVVNRKTDEQISVAEVSTAISPEVLYLLMTAEIAGQRNQYGVALEGYLQAAKRVDDFRIAERAAKIGLFLKDNKRTDEAVSLWLKQDEKNLIARKIAALSALRGRDRETAVDHLSMLLQNDPAGFESTLMELLKVLKKDAKADFVFDVLGDVAKLHSQQATIYFVQAMLAGQMHKNEIAEEKINQALLIQPDWDRALIFRAQIAAQKGDLDLAANTLENILEKTPDNIRVRKMLAQIRMKADKFDEAMQHYQYVLELETEDWESKFAIALIHLQQKNDDQAVIYLKQLVNKPAWDAQASFYLGRIDFKKEQYDSALVWFDKVTKGSYVYDASMGAISVLIKQEDFVGAGKRADNLLARYPEKKVNVLLVKAEIYTEQKDYQQAFNVLTQGLSQFPEHRDLLYTRALIAEKINRLTVLEADLKKILMKFPDDAATLNALGYTLVDRTERYDEAEGYLQRALKINPEEAVIIDSVGWLNYKQGKNDEALKYLRKAYKVQPESEIAAHLAEVLWVMGDKNEAENVFIKAIDKAPNDEYLLKFQERFMNVINK